MPTDTTTDPDDALAAAEASAAAMDEARDTLAKLMGDEHGADVDQATAAVGDATRVVGTFTPTAVHAAPVDHYGAPLVYAAIARVMAEVPGIGKDDKAPEAMGGYRYRGIEAVTRGLQALCGKHGVVIWPAAKIVKAEPCATCKAGYYDWLVEVTWTVAGTDGVALTPAPVTYGIGRDHTDKGVNKAMTAAFKYLLLQLFMVGDGKDDADSADLSGAQRTADDEAAAAERAASDAHGKLLSELSSEVKALTEPQRQHVLDVWTAVDPMTGDTYLPVDADTGKPAMRLVPPDAVHAVRALIAQARKGTDKLPDALPPKDDSDAADGPEAPQGGPGDPDGTDTADEPQAATEGEVGGGDSAPAYAPGEEPF